MSYEKISHLDFRRYITVVLVKSGGIWKKTETRSSKIPLEVRLDKEGHLLDTIKQGRCRICKRNTTKFCTKCEVRLHTDRGKSCWYQYHNNNDI